MKLLLREVDHQAIRQKYIALSPLMDERMRRQWAASEATGLAWNTIKAAFAAQCVLSQRGKKTAMLEL